MLPGENVVWAARKGMFGISLFLVIFGTFVGAFVAFFGFMGGTSNGQPVEPNPTLGWIGAAIVSVGLPYLIISTVITKSTQYVLTNRRIMETRFGKSVKEISLANFMGKPMSPFFDKGAAGMVNNRPVFNIRITNPKSLDDMEFKSLNQSAVEAFERILERARKVIKCKYCKTDNSASSPRCSHCNGPLQ